MAKRVAVIFNPFSRKARTLKENRIRMNVEEVGAELVQLVKLKKSDNFSEVIAETLKLDVDLVIAIGGDGTVRTVIEAMLGSEIPLLVWPRGTANVLAKNLALPIESSELFKLINSGEVKDMHVGLGNGRVFTVGVAVGVPTSVYENMSDKTKAQIGNWAYLTQGIVELARNKPFNCRLVTGDGADIEFSTPALTVLNGNLEVHEFFKVLPPHNLFKKSLKAHSFGTTPNKIHHITNLLKEMNSFTTGRYVKTWEFTSATLYTEPEQPVALDAEVITKTPLKLEISKKSVKVVVPNSR